MALIAAALLTPALPAAAGSIAQDSLQAVVDRAETILAGKILDGDDGSVFEFGEMEHQGNTSWYTLDVTQADGEVINLVDTFVEVDGAALLIEEVIGGDTFNFRIGVTWSDNLKVLPLAEEVQNFSFLCRERTQVKCRKTFVDADGVVHVTTYLQRL